MIVPDSLFIRSIIIRGALLWGGVRLVIAFSGLPAARILLPTGFTVSVLVVIAVVAVAAIELRRRNEFLFLGSLGHAPALMLLLSAIPALPLEAVFTAVFG